MSHIEAKAAQLVQAEQVVVTWRSRRAGLLCGMVRGASGTVYDVQVDPAGEWCSCPHGQHQPGKRCSHTLALQLQAARSTLQAVHATEGGEDDTPA